MSKYLILLITLLMLLVGCKKLDFTKTSSLCAYTEEEDIILRNYDDEPYYYFISEQNATMLINWAAFCSTSNKVEMNNSKKISKKEIYGYTSDDQSIVLYYWKCIDEKPIEINNLVLKNTKPYFSICKNE